MSKIILAGNIKDSKQTKAGKTFLTIWDNYTKNTRGADEVKSRTVIVWFDEDLMGKYAPGDWLELEGEPSAATFEVTDENGDKKIVAMLHVNRPKVIQHRLEQLHKKEQLAFDNDQAAPF